MGCILFINVCSSSPSQNVEGVYFVDANISETKSVVIVQNIIEDQQNRWLIAAESVSRSREEMTTSSVLSRSSMEESASERTLENSKEILLKTKELLQIMNESGDTSCSPANQFSTVSSTFSDNENTTVKPELVGRWDSNIYE